MPAQSWKVDEAHSSIAFAVRHLVIAKVHGSFRSYSAQLEIDETDLTRSRVEATIEAASIDTRNEQRDGHLRTADFLDVERFPTISFQSKRIEPVSGESYRVVGDLSLHGITKEVVLAVELGGIVKDPWGGRRAGLTARATIDRSAFGLVWNQVLETGGLVVGDKVEIDIELEAVAAS